jgi:hypothetical protein
MISRDELYALVWSKPMTKVAEQFGVSGNYMARVCTTLNVPRPERGYWAKLLVGKAPTPPPLPGVRPGDQAFWTEDGSPPPVSKPQAPAKRSKTKRRLSPANEVHYLVRGAKVHFQNSRTIEDEEYLKPYKKLLVDVTASKPGLDKALGFASDVFNALEASGHRVVLAPSHEPLHRGKIYEHEERGKGGEFRYPSLWSPYRPTVTYIGTVAIGLAVVEMSEAVLLRRVRGKYIRDSDYVPPKASRLYADHTWTTTKHLPSGRLRLIAYSPYGRVPWSTDWQETTKTPLTASLRAIVRTIEASAEELVAKLEEADRQAEIEHQKFLALQERWRREEDRQLIEKSRKDCRDDLDRIIERWAEIESVVAFLKGVEARADTLNEHDRELLRERLKLATEFLGPQSPLELFLSWRTPAERYRPRYVDGPEPESAKEENS